MELRREKDQELEKWRKPRAYLVYIVMKEAKEGGV